MALGVKNFLNKTMYYSSCLQEKIDFCLKQKQKGQKGPQQNLLIGDLSLQNSLIMAPLSGISHAAFRLLMQELGAGACVSELISIHGLAYGGNKTKEMLFCFPEETHTGIQLFGEPSPHFSSAAKMAEEAGALFVDLNMGCPVKKVVHKGAGAALLKDTSLLGNLFSSLKKSTNIPVTIKIRTGWDSSSLNALEVLRIAKEEGIEWVAIHGRTRAQGYSGKADWNYIEMLAEEKILPIIGNGDLHTPSLIRQKRHSTKCKALMLGRGPLRRPFIFLESFCESTLVPKFVLSDYVEVLWRFRDLLRKSFSREATQLINLKKHSVWILSGFPRAASLREEIFRSHSVLEWEKVINQYLLSTPLDQEKPLLEEEALNFMSGGHG